MQKRQRFSCQRNVWIHTPQGGGEGYSVESLVGGVVIAGFRPKNVIFPHSFSDLASKIHTRFQTLPLGTYVIITQIRTPTKRFLKIYFEFSSPSITLSFVFIWSSNDKYIHTLSKFPHKPYPFPDQKSKVYTRFRPKQCKNDILRGGTFLYGFYPIRYP